MNPLVALLFSIAATPQKSHPTAASKKKLGRKQEERKLIRDAVNADATPEELTPSTTFQRKNLSPGLHWDPGANNQIDPTGKSMVEVG